MNSERHVVLDTPIQIKVNGIKSGDREMCVQLSLTMHILLTLMYVFEEKEGNTIFLLFKYFDSCYIYRNFGSIG